MNTLHHDGIYQCENPERDYCMIIRFFPDGTVNGITFAGSKVATAEQVVKTMRAFENSVSPDCRYSVSGNEINFTVKGVEYSGVIRDDTLVLRSHSFLNGHESVNTYVFSPASGGATATDSTVPSDSPDTEEPRAKTQLDPKDVDKHSGEAQHEAIPVIFEWLDEAYYGVHISEGYVVVPLSPDTPFMVTAVDTPIAGRLLCVRVPFIDKVPLSPAMYKSLAVNDVAGEGHLHVVPNSADSSIGKIEIRYRIAAALIDQDGLVQLGLRLSMATNTIGPFLQDTFGGVLIRGTTSESETEMTSGLAEWRADPLARHKHRYWDGKTWTEHVSDNGVAAIDPPTAAWLTDPFGRHQHRYWNGQHWTEQVADNGVAGVDPPGVGPSPPATSFAPIPSPAKASAPTPAVTTPSRSAATPPAATPTTELGAGSTASGAPADTATRALVLRMINETHRGTPLENQEVVDLLEGFQRAAGMPTGTAGSVAFMSALEGGTQHELCARPWRWLLSVARQASSAHDDVFVAHVLFWAFAWKSTAEQRFRPLLGVHLVGSIPGDVLGDLKRLADMSLPRLPQDQVLFGDQSGQVTVGQVATAVQATFG
jgi:Protein of unknown function (DUF2510)